MTSIYISDTVPYWYQYAHDASGIGADGQYYCWVDELVIGGWDGEIEEAFEFLCLAGPAPAR